MDNKNWRIRSDICFEANVIAALGFDAVQLSPAQRSIEGHCTTVVMKV